MPIFTSFDEAWSWFECGGELTPIEEQRERFTQGRAQFLSFQAPVNELPIADAIVEIQNALPDDERLIPMDLIALHISILGAGWQVIAKKRSDELLREEVGPLSERAARTLRLQKPIDVTIGPVNVFPDALVLEVHDRDGCIAAMRRALAEMLGGDAFRLDEHEYLPHVTIATFADAAIADTLRSALPEIRSVAPAPATLRRIELARWWFTGDEAAETPERDIVRSYRLG